MSEKQSKRQKRVHNPFINDEAVDGDDGDDDEVFEEMEEDEDDDILDSATTHSRLALRLQQDDQCGRWDELVRRAKSRSRVQISPEPQDNEDLDCTLKAGDILWEIGCKIGYEDIAVYEVIRAAANNSVILARSALAHPGRPGRIYAEVDTMQEARRLATLIDILNQYALRRVVCEDLLPLLYIRRDPVLRSWSWVKVCDRRKRWDKYRGDVGIVRTRDPKDEVAKNFSNKIFIYLVPRSFYPSDDDQSLFPPPRRHLTSAIIREKFGAEHLRPVKTSDSGDPSLVAFRGETYDATAGLLVVAAEKIAVVAEPRLLPSILELRLLNETGFLPRALYTNTVQAITRKRLTIGSRVMVKSGDFKGLVGVIQDMSDDTEECTVDLPSQGLVEDIPLRYLRADFRCGDKLSVVNGQYKGMTGWVIDIDREDTRDTIVTLVNVGDNLRPTTANVLVMDLGFHEDEYDVTLRPRKGLRNGYDLGPRNLNHVYIGKSVVIVNKSQWKGYCGIIKNTSPDGLAWVELQATLIAHNRTQVFRLEQLGLRRTNRSLITAINLNGADKDISDQLKEISGCPTVTQNFVQSSEDPSQSILPSLTLSEPHLESRATTTIPVTTQAEQTLDSLSSRTRPWHYMQDKSMEGSRIQMVRKADRSKIVEFVRVEGNYAVIRVGPKQVRECLDDLSPVRPAKVNDCVILLSGAERGKLFKVKEFRDDGQCVIRRVGVKLQKGQTDPVHRIDELARTYLFR